MLSKINDCGIDFGEDKKFIGQIAVVKIMKLWSLRILVVKNQCGLTVNPH